MFSFSLFGTRAQHNKLWLGTLYSCVAAISRGAGRDLSLGYCCCGAICGIELHNLQALPAPPGVARILSWHNARITDPALPVHQDDCNSSDAFVKCVL